jgi:hypothetical protein
MLSKLVILASGKALTFFKVMIGAMSQTLGSRGAGFCSIIRRLISD